MKVYVGNLDFDDGDQITVKSLKLFDGYLLFRVCITWTDEDNGVSRWEYSETRAVLNDSSKYVASGMRGFREGLKPIQWDDLLSKVIFDITRKARSLKINGEWDHGGDLYPFSGDLDLL